MLTYDGVRMRVGATTDAAGPSAIVATRRARGEIYGRLDALRDRYADAIRTGFPKIPRRVSGYNLPYLLPEHGFNVARALVGSEGTCVMVLRDGGEPDPESDGARPRRARLPDVYAGRRSRRPRSWRIGRSASKAWTTG